MNDHRTADHLFWSALANTDQTSTAGWRGIIPLRSTCEDVKRILKVEKCELPVSEYTFQDTRVVVYFSTCRCCEGWRVNRGTVSSVAVYPLKRQNISELSLDSDYKKIEDEEIKGGVEFVSRKGRYGLRIKWVRHRNSVLSNFNPEAETTLPDSQIVRRTSGEGAMNT